MKALVKWTALAALLGTIGGCAYGAIDTAGDKVVIMRQDSFLFGALRTAFVCKVTDAGLTNCADNESP